jgi:flagellar hook-length control protein FliK
MTANVIPLLKSPAPRANAASQDIPQDDSAVSSKDSTDQAFALVLGQHMAGLMVPEAQPAGEAVVAEAEITELPAPAADTASAILAVPVFFAAPIAGQSVRPVAEGTETRKTELVRALTEQRVPGVEAMTSEMAAKSVGDATAPPSSALPMTVPGVPQMLVESPREYAPRSSEAALVLDAGGQAVTHAMAQAAPSTVDGTASPTRLRVEPEVGAPVWKEAFSDRVAWVVHQGRQVADLHLNPPQLGPVEIHVVLGNDQASISFSSPHAVVRDAIQAALPRLTEVLQNQGVVLSDVSVATQSFSQQQSQGQEFRHAHNGARLPRPDSALGGVESIPASVARNLGMVDIFA